MIDFSQLAKDVAEYKANIARYGKPEPQPEYIVVGDTNEYKGCLMYVCGVDYEWAKECLNNLKNNPTQEEMKRFAGYTNLRIEKVEPEKCWWNQGGLD